MDGGRGRGGGQNSSDVNSHVCHVQAHKNNRRPQRGILWKILSELSTYFLREDSICYDIGFSTGTLLVKINNFNPKIASNRYLIVLILIIGLLYNIFSTNFLLINIYMEN